MLVLAHFVSVCHGYGVAGITELFFFSSYVGAGEIDSNHAVRVDVVAVCQGNDSVCSFLLLGFPLGIIIFFMQNSVKHLVDGRIAVVHNLDVTVDAFHAIGKCVLELCVPHVHKPPAFTLATAGVTMSDEICSVKRSVADTASCVIISFEQLETKYGQEHPSLFTRVHVPLPGDKAPMKDREGEWVGLCHTHC